MCTAKAPDVPKPPPPPEPLKDATAALDTARKNARQRAVAAGGLAGTNVTGGLGVAGLPVTNRLGGQ